MVKNDASEIRCPGGLRLPYRVECVGVNQLYDVRAFVGDEQCAGRTMNGQSNPVANRCLTGVHKDRDTLRQIVGLKRRVTRVIMVFDEVEMLGRGRFGQA